MKLPLLISIFCCSTMLAPAARAGWAEDALISEADYIVDSSFTRFARNNEQVQELDAAYGALNNVRLTDGADWVRPGESAMAIIGLMAAAKQLKLGGYPVDKYEGVADAYFQIWFLKSKAVFCDDPASKNDGGLTSDLSYTKEGALKSRPTSFNSGTTGATLSSLWKYYEFNRDCGRTQEAKAWLNGEAFQLAKRGGAFIARCFDEKYGLVTPSPDGGNLWISDAALSVAGLRCLAEWAKVRGEDVKLGTTGISPTELADKIVSGLQKMKDPGSGRGFFKFLNPADGSKSYDGITDQLCFVPYETDALDSSENFAKEISDGWTKRMTFQTTDPEKWTYYGTRWHLHDGPNPENDRLTPGPGLQLAKVEWKYAHAKSDDAIRLRAMNRFKFANSPKYSNLWFGDDKRSEAGVPGGIVDWRHASEPGNAGDAEGKRAPEWQRFIDTSAYFIEVTLMAFWNKDTKYTPE